ncbi:MAG: peptidylprolyl isomerase [Vicinamibacterales bacterium]
MLTARRLLLLPSLVLLSGLVAACGGGSSSAPSAGAPPASAPADVWAMVDGREIKRDAVEKAFRRTMQLDPPLSEEEALTAKLNLLDEMIVEDILLAKAQDLKIAIPEAELDAAFAEGRKNIADDAFTKELLQRNLTTADMRESVRRDMVVQKVIEREATSKVAVTDQDVNNFYQANREQFNLPEDSYHIAQIVITPEKDADLNNRTGNDAATPQAATAKAQMIMDRLKAGGRFSELAMDYSEEPQTALNGGNVGLVPVSALRQAPPQLRDAVMKSAPGTVSLVSIDGGHTIVLLVAKQAAGQRDPSMPEVRERITTLIRGRREMLMRTSLLSAMRNQAKVTNYLAQRLLEGQGQVPTLTPVAAPPAK